MTHAPQMNHVIEQGAPQRISWDDKHIAYIPLLGAAVALIYDVGFFYAIEINFFTLFSLSEHIVFAIQAFPIALALLIPFGIVMVFLGHQVETPRYEPKDTSKGQRIAAFIALGAIVLVSLSLAGFGILLLSKTNPEFILIVMTVVVLLLGRFMIKQLSFRRMFMVLMSAILTLTVSFAFGYAVGRSYISNNDRPNIVTPSASITTNVVKLKGSAPISGRIIRSGERGLLFFDPLANRLHFVLWDAISSIEAIPQEGAVGR